MLWKCQTDEIAEKAEYGKTTILGMLPLALEFGEGAEMRSSMAVVSTGGLIISAIFNFFVIFIIYCGFEKIGERG